jgi:hypothetical protein
VSCGLAILRGALVGLGLAGAETFLVWVGTTYSGMQLDSLTHLGVPVLAFLRAPWRTVHVVNALFQALSIAIVIAFLASIVERFVKRRGLVIFVAAVLASVFLAVPIFNAGAAQPYPFKVLLLLFDYWVLVWTFARFDVLTLLAAVFTFAFCWENYLLLIMLEPAGALEQWLGFVVFGLIVLGAAALAFRPSLRAGYRRLAASFE